MGPNYSWSENSPESEVMYTLSMSNEDRDMWNCGAQTDTDSDSATEENDD